MTTKCILLIANNQQLTAYLVCTQAERPDQESFDQSQFPVDLERLGIRCLIARKSFPIPGITDHEQKSKGSLAGPR